MRAGDKLQRGLAADRVHRNPEAAVLLSADVVIRLILVPGRALARSGLLGQHVIVVQAHRGAAREGGANLTERRPEYQLPIVAIFLPAAEILDEPPGIVAGAGNLRPRAGMRQILIDARCKEFDFARLQELAQHHGALGLKSIDVRS